MSKKMKALFLLVVGSVLIFGCLTPKLEVPAETKSIEASATFEPSPSETPTSSPSAKPTLAVTFITHGDRSQPYVALTFDVCQIPEYPAGFDVGIVKVLEQYNVPATFFLGGDWMRTHPEETLLLAQNPLFELGDHSWSHPDFRTLSNEEISGQIELTENTLYMLTGRHSRVFRLPYGYASDQALQVIAQHGLYTIQWDVETGDPDPNFDAETILSAVKDGVRNGSIVIMPANGRGWHTAQALPLIIEYLNAQGYKLVTIPQLLGLDSIQ